MTIQSPDVSTIDTTTQILQNLLSMPHATMFGLFMLISSLFVLLAETTGSVLPLFLASQGGSN